MEEELLERDVRAGVATETDSPTTAVKLPVRRRLVRNPIPILAAISMDEGIYERLSVKEDFCRPDLIGEHPVHLFSLCDSLGSGGAHVVIFFSLTSYILLLLLLLLFGSFRYFTLIYI